MRKNGIVMSCGLNNCGQLGIAAIYPSKFVEVSGLPNDIIDIVCGFHHTIVMRVDGTLMSCGNNASGQLGLGDKIRECDKFETISNIRLHNGQHASFPKDIVQISCGSNHTLILTAGGILMGCGDNYVGQLGFNDYKAFRGLFEEVACNVIQLASDSSVTFIKKKDGLLMSCGNNSYGQLGGEVSYQQHLEEVKVGYSYTQISCSNHTLILTTDNTLISCGLNGNGQRGIADIIPCDKFTIISNLPKHIIQINTGFRHSLIVAKC